MGREIIIEGWVKDKQIDLSDMFVCGRDSATSYIANFVLNERKSEDDCYVDLYIYNKDDYDKLLNVYSNLKDYKEKDKKEIEKAQNMLNQLQIAQRNSNYEDFFKFQMSIEETSKWLEDEGWSRAELLLNYINTVENYIRSSFSNNENCFIRIIRSE